jgi:hypothetical protein
MEHEVLPVLDRFTEAHRGKVFIVGLRGTIASEGANHVLKNRLEAGMHTFNEIATILRMAFQLKAMRQTEEARRRRAHVGQPDFGFPDGVVESHFLCNKSLNASKWRLRNARFE